MKTYKILPDQYPFLLKQLKQLPPYLECAGSFQPEEGHRYLCIVGARRYSEYGEQVCKKLIRGLRSYPIIIISGLALGIDSIAHETAMAENIKTIAIPGSGLSDQALYPPSHLHLAKRILDAGNTLLSPFDHDQPGTKWTFPVRNQIMAGMSHAVLVVEGRKGSGTLLTSEYAVQLGRDVLAVPGSIFSDLSYASHLLIGKGATPIFSSRDILESLNLEMAPEMEVENPQLTLDISSFSSDEQMILKELQYAPASSSDIISKTSLSPQTFNVAASKLEITGVVTQIQGYFRISRI